MTLNVLPLNIRSLLVAICDPAQFFKKSVSDVVSIMPLGKSSAKSPSCFRGQIGLKSSTEYEVWF